jgi:hypothetical protein
MIELTEQQRQAVGEGQTPLRLMDSVSGQEYVLIRAELYARLAALAGGDFEVREAYPAIDQAFAPGWDDPKMADYDRYEELKP